MVSQLKSRSLTFEKKTFEKFFTESTTTTKILQFIILILPSQWVVLLREITRIKKEIRSKKKKEKKYKYDSLNLIIWQ